MSKETIIITGDTHGLCDIQKIKDFIREHKEENHNTTVYLIICGDVAVCWDNGIGDKQVVEFFNSLPKNYIALFVDGNHENFDLLNSYRTEYWHGGKVHKITDRLIHLCRGEVFEIAKKRILAIGGADSTDKQFRKEGETWWKDEAIAYQDIQNCLSNCKNKKIDIIISHSPPLVYYDEVYEKKHKILGSEYLLNNIYFKVMQKNTLWFCGHVHIDSFFINNNGEKQFNIFRYGNIVPVYHGFCCIK